MRRVSLTEPPPVGAEGKAGLMTLMDLLKLLKRNWKMVVALPVACMLVCAVVLVVMPKTYSATANVSVSGEPGGIGGVAEGLAKEKSSGKLEVTAKANTTNKTVAITAEDVNGQSCVNTVNEVAGNLKTQAATLYPNVQVQVANASAAVDVSPSLVKYSAVAFLAGLFVAVCIVVLMDMRRAPVHSAAEVEEGLKIRQLGDLPFPTPEHAREAFLANIRFAGEGERALCVVPVGGTRNSVLACLELAQAASQAKVKTLLIEGDLAEGALDAMRGDQGGRRAVGLADVVSKRAKLDACVIPFAPSVDYLPAGSPLVNPVTMLGSSAFEKFVAEAKEHYSLVVVNTSDPANHADFAYIAHAVGNTVLALAEFETPTAELAEVANQLDIASAKVLGFVMVQPPAPAGGRGGRGARTSRSRRASESKTSMERLKAATPKRSRR